MSIPSLPAGAKDTDKMRAANALHSLAVHLLRRARTADKESGLTPERLSLLSVLAYAGPQSVNRLSEIEGVSPPAISRSVSSLEELGLVKRTRNAADNRGVIVQTTPKGKRLMETGRRRRIETIAKDLETLDRKSLAQLMQIGDILERLETRQR